MKQLNRRNFLKSSLLGGGSLLVLPGILPRSLFAAPANSRIQVAQIGCGRMGSNDMESVMAHSSARVVAICDLDSLRLTAGKKLAEEFYKKRGETDVAVKTFSDYRELLAQPDIDAVVVSTPDHWHALVAIEAALAGKHLFVQKPLTYDIAESLALCKAVRAKKVILQTGSQQRSEKPWGSFRTASELVRNGRLGQLKTIKIGIGLDKPNGKHPAPMPVPANLNFERWLGPAPDQPYMEGRVHPQNTVDGRPGWITTEDFGLGMITNWGSHHIDIAQWAMGLELGGPTTVAARANFIKQDVWTVHRDYHVEMRYPNGVEVILDNNFETGLRFEGSEGWIFCTRGSAKVTKSDANVPANSDPAKGPLRASDPNLLSPLGEGGVRWPTSKNHYLNWLEAIAANRDPIAPVEQAARSVQACCVAWIGMKLKRKLTWNPAECAFVDDRHANAMRFRKPRNAKYDINNVMKQAGLA